MDKTGEEESLERTQEIISLLSTKHVFWLMMILPNHAINKSYLPQREACLDQLQDLIHSSKALEFDSLLLKHLDVIPDDFDELISKLKGAFLTNDTTQNSRLLDMTSHEILRAAWVQTKTTEEVTELIKDLNYKKVKDLLAMCVKTVKDEILEKNEEIALTFFGMSSLE